MDLVERVLRQGVRGLPASRYRAGGARLRFFGPTRYGEVSGDVPELERRAGWFLGHGRYACDNDMVCGWAGSLGGADASTSSAALGP